MENITDSTGRTLALGDIIIIKGSDIERVVVGLGAIDAKLGKDVRATRTDGKSQAWSTWSHSRNVTIITN